MFARHIALVMIACLGLAVRADNNSATFSAARKGNVAAVQAAVKATPGLLTDVRMDRWDAPSLLHIAVSAGQTAVVDQLLKLGASPALRDGLGHPVTFATRHHPDTAILARLLEAGANLNDTDDYGFTMLHYVVADPRQHHHAQFLLERGADVNATSKLGTAPLHVAPLDVLLEAGADIHARDWQGRTPAFTATHRQLAVLQRRKASLDVRDINDWTLLHEAAWQGQIPTVEFLLAQGADVNARDRLDWTPLDAATRTGHDAVATLLREHGAAVGDTADDGLQSEQIAGMPHTSPSDRPEDNATIPGELVPERPTLTCLGFKWYLRGDVNRNAAMGVEFRRRGRETWRTFYPALRIGGEQSGLGWVTPHMFAGSVLDLHPGTSYELRLTLHDPDNVKPVERVLALSTRAVPSAATDGRRLHVYAATHRGPREEPAYPDIQAAYDVARPGDVILVHAGNHQGDLHMDKQASADHPIVIRGAGDGEARIQGQGNDIVNVDGSSHHIFEDLTFYDADNAFLARGETLALTVRRCRIHSCSRGFFAISPRNRDFLICDNVLEGLAKEWHPRSERSEQYAHGQGAWISGQGHVACFNRISNYWDGLSIMGRIDADRELQNCSIDFYNNDMTEFIDDAIEMDYGVHNIRVFRNRIQNTFMGISTQPVEGGPGYIWRNQVYGTVRGPLKLNQKPSGLLIFHNTLVGESRAFPGAPGWQNSRIHNNLFIGFKGEWVISGGTPTLRTSRLDFNGYRFFETHREVDKIHWRRAQPWHSLSGGGISRELVVANLAEFTRATPSQFERHGIELDTDIFIQCSPPTPSVAQHEERERDLRLRAGSAAVDAGIRLPGMNDNFAGKAPDLGAFELGQALPHYGPRTTE